MESMKIERLLGIITYLLNREVVSGKQLAARFEVSERTIQRDIEQINYAGIPVTSLRGANGGYQILDTYRLYKQTTSAKDLHQLRLALESLNSAKADKSLEQTLEKVRSIAPKGREIYTVDFGVAKENVAVQELLKALEMVILDEKQLTIEYVNSAGIVKKHRLEPLQLKFKWYSWYLVAYHVEKKQYGIYKLSRIVNVSTSGMPFSQEHEKQKDWFEALCLEDRPQMTTIKLSCDKTSYYSFVDVFHKANVLEEMAEAYLLELTVVEDERLWFAFLLSFGEQIEVLSPQRIRDRLEAHLVKTLKRYGKEA